MKMIYRSLLCAFCFTLSAFSTPVTNDHEPSNQTPDGIERYFVNSKESSLTWKCSMVFASKGGHNGFISLSRGEIQMDKSQLMGGEFQVDMNTITDERNQSDNDLVEHLKSADFFDVDKFPTSIFVITRVSSATTGRVNVTGNLSIKGITREVTFPAAVEVKQNQVHANGKLTIDRSKWDVRYGSGKFFTDLADGAISDDIELEMKIVARK